MKYMKVSMQKGHGTLYSTDKNSKKAVTKKIRGKTSYTISKSKRKDIMRASALRNRFHGQKSVENIRREKSKISWK